VYGSETWAMRVEDMNRLERAEGIMVRSMCGVSLREEKSSDELLGHLECRGRGRPKKTWEQSVKCDIRKYGM